MSTAVSPFSLIPGVIWQISSYTLFALQSAAAWHLTHCCIKDAKNHWKNKIRVAFCVPSWYYTPMYWSVQLFRTVAVNNRLKSSSDSQSKVITSPLKSIEGQAWKRCRVLPPQYIDQHKGSGTRKSHPEKWLVKFNTILV